MYGEIIIYCMFHGKFTYISGTVSVIPYLPYLFNYL